MAEPDTDEEYSSDGYSSSEESAKYVRNRYLGELEYDVSSAALMLRPELALGNEVRVLMRDTASRFAHLPRDMLKACLLPLIPGLNSITDPNILKNRIKRISVPAWANDKYDDDHPESPYAQYMEKRSNEKSRYEELLLDCERSVNAIGHYTLTIILDHCQCIMTDHTFSIIKDGVVVTDIPNPQRNASNWHYVGYNTFLWFITEGDHKFDPDDKYRKMVGYKVTNDGHLVEMDYQSHLEGIILIEMLPCGLAYCWGFDAPELDEDAEYGGCDVSWTKLIDFSVYPPTFVLVDYVRLNPYYGSNAWDYIDDCGEPQRYPDSDDGMNEYRSRSSQWRLG